MYPKLKEVFKDDNIIVSRNALSDISIDLLKANETENRNIIFPCHTRLIADKKQGQPFMVLGYDGNLITEGNLSFDNKTDLEQKLCEAIDTIDKKLYEPDMLALFWQFANEQEETITIK